MAISKFNYNSFNVTPVAGKALSFNSDADGFTTQGASSMVLIKTLTASSSGTLSFVDGASSVVLDNTYPVYKFVFTTIHGSANANFVFQTSTDTGSSYGVALTSTFFNAWQNEAGNDTTLAYSTSNDQAQGTSFQRLLKHQGNADDAGSGTLTLFNPSSTTFVKHFISDGNSANNTYSQRELVAGYFNTTSAIDAVQFKMASGNIDAGTIKLYGIKDS